MKNYCKSIILIIFIGCTNTIDLPEYKVSREKTLFDESSKIKLSTIHSLTNYKDNLLFYDIKTNKIIIYDFQRNDITRIGSTGKGPNQFLQLGDLTTFGDTVFFFDNGNRRTGILNLKNDSVSTTNKYPRGFQADYSRFIADKEGKFYLSNLYSNKPIIELDRNLVIRNEFGEQRTYTDHYKPSSNSFFHLLGVHDYIIAVDVQAPLINIYKKNGELRNRYDLSNLSFFSGRIKEAQNLGKSLENSSKRHFVFFQDAVIYNDEIYLLAIQNDKNKMLANSLIKGNIKNGILQDFEIIKLLAENKSIYYYSSICIIKNHLFAFDIMTSEIDVFDLGNTNNINLPNFKESINYERNIENH